MAWWNLGPAMPSLQDGDLFGGPVPGVSSRAIFNRSLQERVHGGVGAWLRGSRN